jgi:crotonobetainyl-CoA:carnitine CoA-transferase CaiB-like acyl-CoA transferase
MRSNNWRPTVSSEGIGPLAGLRVVELASETGAYCGKLLADMGAEVLLIEPPGGHHTRRFGPFAADTPGDDRSLWFWHYNTSKLGVELDLASLEGATAWRTLVANADVVLEAELPGALDAMSLGERHLRDASGKPTWVSISAYGRDDPRSLEPFTDLTAMSRGGMVWSCGYDDHSLPPVRGEGNQAYQTVSMWAAIAAVVAVLGRDETGVGQFIDVSMHAAVNVTTEQSSHFWLVSRKSVRRQTGRHAAARDTEPVVNVDRDGHEVHTGFPPRTVPELRALIDWIDGLGLRERCDAVPFLELAVEAGGIDLAMVEEDPMMEQFASSSREALTFVAANLTAQQFFVEGQQRGFAVGAIYSPDEAMQDEHLIERGFPTPVFQPQLGRQVIHPGAPIRFTRTPWQISRHAPSLAEHQELLADLVRSWATT